MTWLWAAIGLWLLVGLIGAIIHFKEAGRRLDRMISWAAMPEEEDE